MNSTPEVKQEWQEVEYLMKRGASDAGQKTTPNIWSLIRSVEQAAFHRGQESMIAAGGDAIAEAKRRGQVEELQGILEVAMESERINRSSTNQGEPYYAGMTNGIIVMQDNIKDRLAKLAPYKE